MATVLITGANGLIGSECVRFFLTKGFAVHGIDNNMRQYFFGADGDTTWKQKENERLPGYTHHAIDIRNKEDVEAVFREYPFAMVIHTAAQPSHDWAAKEPITDFTVNALGTLILLEHTRLHSPKATFILTSTNKVYGDRPNALPLLEQETRYELPSDHLWFGGIDETMSIDNTLHSVFGASKVAADVMTQEYGKYFGMHTGVFRGGCLTGPAHSAAELHGFLAYLVKCIATGKKYTIFGYKGKQVRDNEHAADVVGMFWHYHQKPRQGEVYNTGGGRENSVSILEAITKIEVLLNKKAVYEYKDENRIGDHQWYITDTAKFSSDYPGWSRQYSLDRILKEICAHYT